MTRACSWLVLAVAVTLAQSAAAKDTPPSVTFESWREDLDVIARELPKRHPDLFFRMSHATWDSAVAATRQRLPGMSRNQAIAAFMELVALPRDGHTSINPIFDAALRFRYYPLELYTFDDGLFVSSADSAHARLVGARVVRIGTVTAEKALAAVARTIPAENEWWTRAWADERVMMPEFLDGLGLAKDVERLPVVVELKGREQTVLLRPSGTIEPRGHNPVEASTAAAG